MSLEVKGTVSRNLGFVSDFHIPLLQKPYGIQTIEITRVLIIERDELKKLARPLKGKFSENMADIRTG
jgi:hypothetical protein